MCVCVYVYVCIYYIITTAHVFFLLGTKSIFSSLPNRHTIEMIDKLESAGLGYHVSADKTEDKLGIFYIAYIIYFRFYIVR